MLGAINHSELAGGDDVYLAQNLKYLREQKGFTQQEFAEVLGVKQRTISSWEYQSRTPDLETIVKLAEYFCVSLDDLILRDMRPPIPIYASNLAYLRKLHGMTQQEIAELIGLKNKSSMSLVEAGMNDVSVENLEKLADFYGVTMDQLVKVNLSTGKMVKKYCRLCEDDYDFRKLVINQCVGEWTIGFRGSLRSCNAEDRVSFCPECGRELTDEDFEKGAE